MIKYTKYRANTYPNVIKRLIFFTNKITKLLNLNIFNLLYAKHYPWFETESRNVVKFINLWHHVSRFAYRGCYLKKKKTITRLYPVSLPPVLISNFHFYNITNMRTVVFFFANRSWFYPIRLKQRAQSVLQRTDVTFEHKVFQIGPILINFIG